MQSQTDATTKSISAKTTKHLVVSLVVVAVVTVWFARSYRGHDIVSADANDNQVSAARGFAVLTDLLRDQKPHPAGSPENEAVRKRLKAHMCSLGYQITEAAFTARGVSMTNLLATLPGDANLRPILLATHYDSVEAGPGAGDAGSCIAALAETARWLIQQKPKWSQSAKVPTVYFLFTDGEEWVRKIGHGLNGAEYFVQNQNQLLEQRPFILNFDARGATGPSLLYESSRNNLKLMQYILPAVPRPVFTASSYVAIYDLLPNATDFTEFKAVGIDGLNFAFIDDPHLYHTPDDTLQNLDIRSVQHHANNASAFLKQWCVSPPKDLQANENAVFFEVLGQWIVCYPEGWSLWFAVCVFSLNLLGTIKAVRSDKTKRISAAAVFDSSAAMLIGAIGCVIAGWGLSQLEDQVPRSSHGFGPDDPYLICGLWICAFLSMKLAFRFLAQRATTESTWTVVWMINALLGIATSQFVPGFSYIFLTTGLVPGLLSVTRLDRRTASVIAVAVAAIFLVPLAWQFGIALGLRMVIVLSVLYAMFMAPVYPLLATPRTLRNHEQSVL
ncbi:MAG: M28 family peptidase [Fuerstiella sp.]